MLSRQPPTQRTRPGLRAADFLATTVREAAFLFIFIHLLFLLFHIRPVILLVLSRFASTISALSLRFVCCSVCLFLCQLCDGHYRYLVSRVVHFCILVALTPFYYRVHSLLRSSERPAYADATTHTMFASPMRQPRHSPLTAAAIACVIIFSVLVYNRLAALDTILTRASRYPPLLRCRYFILPRVC